MGNNVIQKVKMLNPPERKLNRLRGHNYSYPGIYCITICVKDRMLYLGKVKDKKMILNKFGDIVKKYWEEIPDHYQDIKIDEYIIMPNHIHGLIIIKDRKEIEPRTRPSTGTGQCPVPTDSADSENGQRNYGLLSKIIKSFKEVCSKQIRKELNDYKFGWQRSFYDRIIKNKKDFDYIKGYIRNNPTFWDEDEENPVRVIEC